MNGDATESNYQVQLLRAGGGGGSGGGGSSGGGSGSSGSHSSRHRTTNGNGGGSVLGTIFHFIMFACISCAAAIVFRLKLFKYSRNSKKIIKMLQTKDSAWKYKNIEKQVHDAYFIIQNSWTNMDMQPAQGYMSEELYERFKTKLSWMECRKQKNVLKKIRLIEVTPVSVYDDENDKMDYVWFYIKGSMIDYMIDTETNLKISGNTSAESFEEYWQFVRNSESSWVLNKILQKDESGEIVFSE
ncbi:MAG: Tim44 domain-containing protein [Clostridia bacterium]|nr:Tim44 domain-containing protein [Clostridia bacterium]